MSTSTTIAIHEPHTQLPAEVSKGLVIFVKPHCPFCARIKLLMQQLGLDARYLDFEKESAVYNQVASITKHDTLPLVLYDGEFIGGCDDTCVAVEAGTFQRRLNLPTLQAAVHDGVREKPLLPGLFMFPPIANRWVTQGVALQVVVLSIIIIIWRNHEWAHWLCFAMAADFLVRVIAGGTPSMLGATVLPIAAFLPEELVPGAPKQFAAIIGLLMFTLATILFLAGNGDTSEIGGSVVVGLVLGAAFLEGVFNFCVGCYFFGLANSIGLVSDRVYQPYTDTVGMFNHTMADQNRKKGWAPFAGGVEKDAVVCDRRDSLLSWRRRIGGVEHPVPIPVRVRQATHPSGLTAAIDYKYKFPKTDETIREHWGVRYLQPDDFAIPLGIAGFAAALRATSLVMWVPHQAYEVAGLIAGILHGVFLLLYIVKAIIAPRKVYADYQHPFKRNAFVIIPITHLIFVYLLAPDPIHSTSRANAQEVLFWSGIILYSITLLLCLAGWVRDRAHSEHMNPSFLFPAAGALVVALVAPFLAARRGTGYLECALLYLGLGLFFYLVFFTITFSRGFTYHWSDDRLRPIVAFWMAGAFLAQVAYQAVTGAGWDTVAYMFFAVGLFLFLANVYLVFPGRWLLRGKFEIANWALTFPLDVFVFAAVNYYQALGHGFSKAVLWIALIFAGWANYTMFFHTLTLFLTRKWPRAPVKWSPLSFNKLQHEAMRAMIAQMQDDARCAYPDDPEGHARYRARLIERWNEYARMLSPHTTFEDEILFPELDGFNANQTRGAAEQHELIEEQMAHIGRLVATSAQATERDTLALRDAIIAHGDLMLDHVQWEEDHLQPMSRKNLNLALTIDIVRRMWAAVPLADMEHLIVTSVRHLPMHGQRVRLVKTLLWALPERSQQIGGWLYRGLARDPLGDMKYQLIVEDLPEMIPRDTSLRWTRFL